MVRSQPGQEFSQNIYGIGCLGAAYKHRPPLSNDQPESSSAAEERSTLQREMREEMERMRKLIAALTARVDRLDPPASSPSSVQHRDDTDPPSAC